MSPSHPNGSQQALLFEALAPGRARTARRIPRPAGAASGRRRGLLYWLPVVVALGAFAQLSLNGLAPALRESARLGAAETLLLERHAAELGRGRTLERVLRAQADPIYLERERRLLLDPQASRP